jgi:predicted RNase H-like HicB family nuclease
MDRKFVIVLTEDESGGIVAECPSLPGCYSQGETRDEAIENIREAIQLSLETRQAQGSPVQITSVEITELHLAVNG